MPLLFAITLFVSALLLFLIQPIIAKMILPSLGGTPAVWNTCMVFFQAVLLAGYAYAHASTGRLGRRPQILLHVGLLLLPLLVLPLGMASGWVQPGDVNPTLWLLGLLTVSVGLPFFVLSTSAPLLQKWFAQTGHRSAGDPYFLYAASNLGSMLALLSYPVLVEPNLPLKARQFLSQSWLWSMGYGLMVVLMGCCAWVLWRRPRAAAVETTQAASATSSAFSAARTKSDGSQHITRLRQQSEGLRELRPQSQETERGLETSPALTRLRWIALAFVPSSLMLGVTSYITLDIAAIPLLWLIPLTLYLLSFILVFAKWPPLAHKILVLGMPLVLLLLIFVMMSEIKIQGTFFTPEVWTILLHLLVLLVVALVCHGELARTRPSTEHLTEFYLLMSVGGVLGGLFNALVAPLVFNRVVEYQLAMVFAALLLPRLDPEAPGWIARRVGENKALLAFMDLGIACGLGILAFCLFRFLSRVDLDSGSLADWQSRARLKFVALADLIPNKRISADQIRAMLTYGVPILICYAMVGRSLRFGLGVGALLAANALCDRMTQGEVLYRERSFFGVLAVKKVEQGVSLVNGTTLHGLQDPERPLEPLTYYHRSGPVGQLFSAFQGDRAKKNLALIGLGSGTLAAYGEKGQSFTFYEIDKAVVKVTCELNYFTYYRDAVARGVNAKVVLGDARLRLQEAPDHQYDLILVDAFSSDAIPIHLITREAMQLYFQKLTKDGIVAVHVSNRFLDLEPVLANLQQDLGLAALGEYDSDDRPAGKAKSDWVVLAQNQSAFGSLNEDVRWVELKTESKVGVWTDDYSNLLGVLNWRTKPKSDEAEP